MISYLVGKISANQPQITDKTPILSTTTLQDQINEA